ncbi:MAG TPA: ABC transporter permease subunit [Polyangiaceae bacterium]
MAIDKNVESELDESADEEEEEEEEEEETSKPSKSSKPSKPSAESSESPRAADPGAMSMVRNTLTIAKRELRSYFDGLVAYVVIGLSMLGLGVYFFLYQGGFWQVDRATMGRLFDVMPLAFCFVIPLITMGVLAEEKRSGTIELLITMPVKDSEVILGKYFAALGLCTILLLASLTYPVAMFAFPWHLGPLDWGPVWTGYLGLFLFASAGVAIGMMFSSFTESQIIAFFLTAGVMLLFYAIGFIVETLPGAAGDIISFVSFQTRFLPFARGLIDIRAVVYFLSIAVICLLVSFRSLESRKWK